MKAISLVLIFVCVNCISCKQASDSSRKLASIKKGQESANVTPLQLTGTSGNFTSPNHPDLYPPSTDLIWVISVPEYETVQLAFENFNLESGSPQCEFDFVEIHDGDSKNSSFVGKFCGTSLPPAVNSSGQHLWVKFHSDAKVAGSGFSANYTALSPLPTDWPSTGVDGALGTCGGEISEATFDDREISSPSYPRHYDANEDCVWTIRVPEGERVRLAFEVLDLETSADCSYDFVEIRDGESNESALLGRFCNHSLLPAEIVSTSNKLRVYFHSDGVVEAKGFLAGFEAVKGPGANSVGCNHVLTEPRGGIAYYSSENVLRRYQSHVTCTWLITAPEGYHVVLKREMFNVEEHAACEYDALDVHDGGSADSTLIGSFCGSTERFQLENSVLTQSFPPMYIASSSKNMFVAFRSDDTNDFNGFRFRYFFKPGTASACNSRLFATELPQRFFSHSQFGYAPLKSNANCSWTIVSARESDKDSAFELPSSVRARPPYTQIKFNFFEVGACASNVNCSASFVELVGERKQRYKLCGSEPSPTYVIGGDVEVRLRATSSCAAKGGDRGFSVEFQRHPLRDVELKEVETQASKRLKVETSEI